MRTKAHRSEVQPKPAASLPRVLPDRWREPAICIALLILTLLAFSNSFEAGFTVDNKGLLHDPRLAQATARNVGLILHHSYWWPNGEAGLYRPLTTLSYLFNYTILGDGDQPSGFHWLNFIAHAINVLLVYALLLRLTARLWMAGLIAAAWAVHPLLTESVTNIIGRADLLAGCATLGGFLMYLKSAEAKGLPRAAWLAGLMAITFAGVFSKESAVCIVGVIVLYELVRPCGDAAGHGRLRISALLIGCAATAVPIGVMLYQRSKVLAASLPAEFPFTDNPIVGANFWIGRLTAVKVIARYLWLLVWPAKLSIDYSYPEIPLVRGTFSDWLCWIVVLGAIVLAGYAYRSNKIAFFLAGFSAVTFFPTSNLALPIGTIMAERFMYLPSIGLLACLVLAIYWACERFNFTRLAPAVVCLMIVCFAIRTWARNADWLDERSIVAASLEASSDSYKLHKQMAAMLYGAERTPENIQRGKEEAEKSVALIDSLPDAQNTAEPFCLAGGYDFMEGELLSSQSGNQAAVSPAGIAEYQRGIARVERCAAIDKSVHNAYNARLASLSHGRMRAPEGDPQPYLMLSAAYVRLGDTDKAVDAVREALRLHPRGSSGYLQVADVFMRKNLTEDAAVALTEGLLLTSDPGLAQALASVPDAGSCSSVQSATGPAANPLCAKYRQRACALSAEVVDTLLRAGREDLAEQKRLDLVRNYGCSTAALDSLFPPSRP